jgi:radical SAM superfamily enzyme YgiQ (UPF0313 family)
VDVQLMDENVGAVDTKAEVDLVGISSMTASAPRAYQIADEFRARGVPVVLGGMHPTAMPEEAARHADAVVMGEAEGQWETLLEDFGRGQMKPLYRSDERPSLEGLPLPRRDLLKRSAYLLPNMIHTARGCPHACTFCSVTPVFGRKYRFRPVDEVVEEVRSLGVRSLGFGDDNIVASPARAKQLFEKLIPLKLQWVGQGDLSMAKDPELMDLMRRSGCVAMFVGLESTSPESLALAHKQPNLGLDLSETIDTVHRHGLDIIGSFVFGLDADTAETCTATLEFAMQKKLAAAQFAVLTPFPGTPVYEQLMAEDRILDPDWSKYTMGNVVFKPQGMSPAELAAERAKAYDRFYSMGSIARRMLVWRGGHPKVLLRAVTNLSYRRINRGGRIWSSVPHDGRVAAPRPVR